MRSYVTIVDGDMDILPFFARYYTRALGVDEFFLLTFGTKTHQNLAASILHASGARVVRGPIEDPETFLAGTRDRIIQDIHRKGEWAFFTDIDEFPALHPPTAIKLAKENYIAGVWLDRVGANGRLVKIVQDKRLVDQFPLCGHVRKAIHLHARAYIMHKGGIRSHHPKVMPKLKYAIHHFKWTDTLLRRLRTRYERVKKTHKRSWMSSIAKTIRLIDTHNGIPLSLLSHVKNDIDV